MAYKQASVDDEVRALAYRVFGLLHHYIAIHNDMIGRKWFQWFRRVDFDGNAGKLAQISSALALAKTSVVQMQSSPAAAARHQEYLGVLTTYVDELFHTVELLKGIATRLARKARSEKYSMADYRRDMKEYRASVQRYRRIGELLKRAWETAEL